MRRPIDRKKPLALMTAVIRIRFFIDNSWYKSTEGGEEEDLVTRTLILSNCKIEMFNIQPAVPNT